MNAANPTLSEKTRRPDRNIFEYIIEIYYLNHSYHGIEAVESMTSNSINRNRNHGTVNTFKRRLDEALKDGPVKFNHKVTIVTESD